MGSNKLIGLIKMAFKYRTKGFIFKKNDINESDRVFSIFTQDFGRLEIKAKALRKITSKLRADIDIFYLSEIEFIQGKNNKTLTDAVKIKKFDTLQEDFKRFKIAHRVSEVLDNFLKGQQKDDKAFDLLNEFFDRINHNSLKIKNYQLVFQYFFWNFLSVQGYHLEVENCATCRGRINPYNVYFSNKEGGIICEDCLSYDKDAKKVNSDVIKILRLILKKDWDIISRLRVGLSSQNLLEEVCEDSARAFCPAHC